MKIAQVAPLYESVPPQLYGGTERVVSWLTEELVELGHDVTLFASGDSLTQARLVPACRQALRLSRSCRDPLVYHMLLLDSVFEAADSFDLVHFHIDYLHFPYSKGGNFPHLTTLHGRLDLPDLKALYARFGSVPLVSISNSQRGVFTDLNWLGTVYHGSPSSGLNPRFEPGNYLAFLGRISPEKRVDRAIEIAKNLGVPIKIAAKVDAVDREYFYSEIEPLLTHPLVEYIGEIGDQDKADFLGHAIALLFPIDWPEPFGLCMIEAMACGTPVVAYERGATSEIIEDGRNGFIVQNIEEACLAVRKASALDRREIRRCYEDRFTSRRMAEDYLRIYETCIDAKRWRRADHARAYRVAAEHVPC